MNQLLKLIKAKYLFLGLKDFQQLYLIKKFIKNKYYIKVVPVKTVRFKNSLAYSSRNKLLSSKEIDIACKIAKRIYSFNLSIKKNFKNVSNLNNLKNNISKHNIKLEYLEIRNKIRDDACIKIQNMWTKYILPDLKEKFILFSTLTFFLVL